jgi:decaprenyl-phosphate phosphoribosyltransferase
MHYLLLLRPHSWIKNFFVFIPLFFAHDLFSPDQLTRAIYAFLAFCALASCVYVINDIVDRESDRRHPQKQHRPVASRRVSLPAAWLMAAVLLLIAIGLTHTFVPSIRIILAVYFLGNLAYSFYLKRVPIVDLLMVSAFYVLRVSAGAVAISVPVSGWLLIATIFVALFLITAKRKAELVHADTRAVLQHYTPEFLNILVLMSVVMTLVVYSVYTVTVLGSHRAVYAMFFVLLGVFRYLYLSYRGSQAEQPERLIFSDGWIFVSAVGWIAFMYMVLYP